ncbi:MAG: GspE/PulE family protein [Bacteroidales bacterium]
MAMKGKGEALLGELMVREGLITEPQLQVALKKQAESKSYVPLGQVLIGLRLITQRQLNLVLGGVDKRPKLGEVLVRAGAITQDQLDHALKEQKKRHIPLGQLLVKLGYVTDEGMRQCLALQLNIAFIDLDRTDIDKGLSRFINRNYARRHSLVPVSCSEQILTICMDDPSQFNLIEELNRTTGYIVTVVTAPHESITRAFQRIYGEGGGDAPTLTSSSSNNESVDLVSEDEGDGLGSQYLDDGSHNKRADAIVRDLLGYAIGKRSSDIHIETLATNVQVRFRTDGVLQMLRSPELEEACKKNGREVISRLKVLAKLDIAERRRPQDGSFRVRVERDGEQASIDLRMSVVPGYYGESVVLRLLDRKRAPQSLADLGFAAPVEEKFKGLINRPSGIVLVTGPTGSGKSTTLYAALMMLYKPEIRILTAEDPVEYVYEQFSQSEVNERIGNTFAAYLRAFLRHDPEVIMVGEIRDEETAEMALRAAQTGHLLLSTLHTTSAVAVVPRLLDLKVDPNLLASCLNGVVAQRLIRRVCPECKAEYRPPEEMLREFFAEVPKDWVFYKGRGCSECNYSGYRGRTTVAELWVPSAEDIFLITKNAPYDELRVSAKRTTHSMADEVHRRLRAGETNLEEIIRMLPYEAIYEFRQKTAEESV